MRPVTTFMLYTIRDKIEMAATRATETVPGV